MNMQEKLTNKLQTAFAPEQLEVQNQSHLHSGHAGDDGSGESHFHILISSSAFENASRVSRERDIYGALADEMKIIHALSIQFI